MGATHSGRLALAAASVTGLIAIHGCSPPTTGPATGSGEGAETSAESGPATDSGPGALPGQFDGVHQIEVDQEGNLYVTEVANDRSQKFRPKPDADPARLIRPMVGRMAQ